MKVNIKRSAVFILGLLAIISCKKITTDKVSKVVKVSYPMITLKGDSVVSIPVGGSYSDPGAVLTDDITGSKSDITATTSDLNTKEPGLYFMVYTATNSNGFQTTVERPIAVTSVPASWDLSGTYARTSNGAESHVSKVAPGLYYVDNVGGVLPPSDAILPVYMVNLDDSTIAIPEQNVPNNYGTISVEDPHLMLGTDTSFSYVVINPGFGTAVRKFVKQ
jgi:hypothetical protein